MSTITRAAGTVSFERERHRGRRAARRPGARSSALDVVRVLAVVAVVAGHAYPTDWAATAFFPWHVPVFFVLSGYLWSRDRTLLTELRRRARTLLVPYLVWAVLVTVTWALFQQHQGTPLARDFYENVLRGGANIGRPFSAFWFITSLFVAVVLARVLQRIAGTSAIWLVGLIGLGVVLVDRAELKLVWFGAGVAVPALLFIAAGITLRDLRPRIRLPLLWGALAMAAGWGLIYAGVPPLNIKMADFGEDPLPTLAGILISVGLVLIAEAVFDGPLARVQMPSTLALASMPVVLGHALLLSLLAESGWSFTAIFAVALVLPWLVGLVALRVRPARALLL